MQPSQQAASPSAGWLADPWAAASWRWWDGAQWTGRTAPAEPTSALVPIRTLAGQTLQLDRKQGIGRTDLVLGRRDDAVAYYGVRSGDRERAPTEAHAAEGHWLFVPQAHDRWEVHIVSLPSGVTIARFDVDGTPFNREGTLSFPDGRRFGWQADREPEPADSGGARGFLKAAARKVAEAMSGHWEVVTHDARRVVSASNAAKRGEWSSSRSDGFVMVDPAAVDQAELPVIVLLTGYILFRIRMEEEARRRRHADTYGSS